MLAVPRARLTRLAAVVVALGLAVPAAVAGSTAGASAAHGGRRLATAGPCGRTAVAPRYRHVVWVVMENDPYGAVIGSPSAPFTTALSHRCGIADNYDAVTHPSLPNYLALAAGSTFGIADDLDPSAHLLQGPSIFSQVSTAHLTWRSYDESMGQACEQVTTGLYAVRHNPAAYFVPLRPQCERDDIPMGPLDTGAMARALASPSFPSFAFVTPNVCHDAHSCPLSTGDAWLRSFVHLVTTSRTYRQGHLALFVTWDEGSGTDQRVPLLAVAPSVPRGRVVGAHVDHYSLLRTTEQLLGLPPLRNARHARSMVAAFHL